MGCFMSVERNGSQAGDMPGFEEDYKKIINAKCPHIRLDCIKQLKTLKVKGENYNYRLRYGYVSQRGYYPHGVLILWYFAVLTLCWLVFLFNLMSYL